MKIAVCEDNAADLNQICEYINKYCEVNQFLVDIDTYSSSETLLEAFPKEKYTIIFLDIIMDGLSGIDAARKIRALNQPCTIVFITVSKEHSLEAYSVDGAAYVLKPLSAENMNRALDKCRRDFLSSSRYITVAVKEMGMIDIPIADLLFVEVDNKTLFLHAGTQIYKTSQKTMKELAKELNGAPFIRCHRSYIVNMSHVETLKKGEIILTSGDKVNFPIRSYTKVQKAFGNYLTKKLREDLI
ncbi:MAG: LytR/AlgR family response regulator transcription factor [Lachnospiraceae bacterium]